MGLSEISDAIKSTLEGVEGIGTVHDYERWAKSWEKFLELFKTEDGLIHGWTFTRKQTATQQITVGEKERAHVFVIRGVYGLQDEEETETTFQGLIEDIVAAFDEEEEAAEPLNGTCLTISPDWGPMAGAVGIQVAVVEHRVFGKVLCHYGELRLCAVETIAI